MVEQADWGKFGSEYRKSEDKVDFYKNKVEDLVKGEAELLEGEEDYRTKLGLLTQDQLEGSDYSWSNSESGLTLSAACGNCMKALGSQRPVFDAMLMVSRIAQHAPEGFNADDPAGLSFKIHDDGKIDVLSGEEVIVKDLPLLEEQALAEKFEEAEVVVVAEVVEELSELEENVEKDLNEDLTEEVEVNEVWEHQVKHIYTYLLSSANCHSAARQLGENKEEYAMEWARAVRKGMEDNGIEFTNENLSLCLTQIEREGAYFEDPKIPDTDAMYNRYRSRLDEEIENELSRLGPAARFARGPIDDFIEKYDSKYRAELLAAETEGEIDGVFTKMVEEMEQDEDLQRLFFLPVAGSFFREVWDEKSEELRHPVRTIGAMQINLSTARRVAESKGYEFENDDELRDYLYTKEGNLDIGFGLIATGLDAYVDSSNGNMEHVFIDYNAGVYTCRNAAFQSAVNELMKEFDADDTPLVLDGDLLIYESHGGPSTKVSNSQARIAGLVEALGLDIDEIELSEALVQEKEKSFEETNLYTEVMKAYERQFGRPAPYAVYPEATVHGSVEKFGQELTANTYLRGSKGHYSRVSRGVDTAEVRI